MDAVQTKFTRYQMFVVGLLAFLQFTVVLDFMILSPLSAILLGELHITTAQFGHVVSAYAFSAGASAFLAAGFADRFDRKHMMLFFYSGFLLGTLFCGLAPNYHFLLAARIFTGLFGGVITSISLAIVADLFHFSQRGRVMGFVQSAFAASQVLGIPAGLYLATHYGWHFPFLMIVAIGLIVGLILVFLLRPIDSHLDSGAPRGSAFANIWKVASRPRYQTGFAATLLLTTGGFMLMPFGAAYMVHNLGMELDKLPLIYMVTGVFTMVAGPLLGKLSDHVGKFNVFAVGTFFVIGVILYYTHMGPASMRWVIVVNIVMFIFITSRAITSAALNSAVPELKDRGAYMSVNSALQQISGGAAAWVAGMLVVQTPTGFLDHYSRLGWVVAAAMLITLPLMWNVHRITRHPANAASAK